MEFSSVEVEVEGCGSGGKTSCELRIIAPVVAMEAQTLDLPKTLPCPGPRWENLETGPKVLKIGVRDTGGKQQCKTVEAGQTVYLPQKETGKTTDLSHIHGIKSVCASSVPGNATMSDGGQLSADYDTCAHDCRSERVDCEKTFQNPSTSCGQPFEGFAQSYSREAEDTDFALENGGDFSGEYEAHTWHGATKDSGGVSNRQSRSITRNTKLTNPHHRGSLDSKSKAFLSDGLQNGCSQGTTSLQELPTGQNASLLDIMHKKFCSRQYDLEHRARSVDHLHKESAPVGFPVRGIVHSQSDYQVNKPPTIALNGVEQLVESCLTLFGHQPEEGSGQARKPGRKGTRCPASLPKVSVKGVWV